MTRKISYRGNLDADRQISTEEKIASLLHYSNPKNEEACSDASREILYLVLREFRPDLFVDFDNTSDPVRNMKWAYENLLDAYKQAAACGIHEMSGDIEGGMAALDNACKTKKKEFMEYFRAYKDR